MSSTRLAGKSLADVGGEPMLSPLLRRLKRARRVSEIVVATSVEAIDDRIASLVSEEEIPGPGTTFEGGKWVERTRASVEDTVERARA